MFCILILWLASPLSIPGKSRMRKRARTDLCGGRSAMVVPTATVDGHDGLAFLDSFRVGRQLSPYRPAERKLGDSRYNPAYFSCP